MAKPPAPGPGPAKRRVVQPVHRDRVRARGRGNLSAHGVAARRLRVDAIAGAAQTLHAVDVGARTAHGAIQRRGDGIEVGRGDQAVKRRAEWREERRGILAGWVGACRAVVCRRRLREHRRPCPGVSDVGVRCRDGRYCEPGGSLEQEIAPAPPRGVVVVRSIPAQTRSPRSSAVQSRSPVRPGAR